MKKMRLAIQSNLSLHQYSNLSGTHAFFSFSSTIVIVKHSLNIFHLLQQLGSDVCLSSLSPFTFRLRILEFSMTYTSYAWNFENMALPLSSHTRAVHWLSATEMKSNENLESQLISEALFSSWATSNHCLKLVTSAVSMWSIKHQLYKLFKSARRSKKSSKIE